MRESHECLFYCKPPPPHLPFSQFQKKATAKIIENTDYFGIVLMHIENIRHSI